MSEEFQNRIGYDNFSWWIGVVEDNVDPMFLGRCRIRIFGSHTDNLKLIPTEDLPWALPLYPVNNSRQFSTPIKGDYVFGFFSDGTSAQAPVFMGVFPGIPQGEPKPGIGFSALAAETKVSSASSSASASTITGDEALQAFEDAQAAQLAAQEGSAFSTPSVPSNAPALKPNRVGEPTTPKNAYSVLGTMVQVTNLQVTHACDFRFLINFADLNIGVIENPIKLIEQAIKNAKNKAAAIIKALLQQIMDKFRSVLKGITLGLNFDPTGRFAKLVSRAREIVRTINYYSKKLAEYIGNAALIVFLIKEIQQIIDWIRSLPANLLALLKDCLANFQGAVSSAVNQIALIPGQISSSVENAFGQLITSTEGAISEAQAAEVAANVPNTLITLVTSPTTANMNVIMTVITDSFPNSNVIIANASNAAFNVANSSTP